MKDLKKYRVPIIGGIASVVISLWKGGFFPTEPTTIPTIPFLPGTIVNAIIFPFIVGAVVAFIIDKVWK